jgi:hypothetical protein
VDSRAAHPPTREPGTLCFDGSGGPREVGKRVAGLEDPVRIGAWTERAIAAEGDAAVAAGVRGAEHPDHVPEDAYDNT